MKLRAIIAAVLLLAGCSANKAGESTPPAPPSTVTVTPTPTGPPSAQRYATVEALKDAAVGAGYACPAWVQDDVIPFLRNVAPKPLPDRHGEPSHFKQADLDEQLPVFESKVAVTGALLIGPNWIINADDVPSITRLATKLGGTVER